MKPDEAYDKAAEEGLKNNRREVVIPLSGEITYSTMGCKHHLIQKDATTAECEKCGRGFYGVNAEEWNKRYAV